MPADNPALLSDEGSPVEPKAPPRRPAPVEAPVRRTLARREARLGYAFTAPALLIVLVLVLFPILWNIALSLQEIRLVELRNVNLFRFDVTTSNYEQVIGPDFLELLRNTLIYSIGGTTLALLLGLWAALALRKVFRGRALLRGLMLFPYVVPVVAATLLWRTMLNPQVGFISVGLQRLLGTGPLDPLLQRDLVIGVLGLTITLPLALIMVVLFEAWRSFPFAFLFILARLQALGPDLEEAAAVDGATVMQRFWHIVLPQLRGVFAVLFLLRFIWTFNAFDEIYLLTAGSAGTEVIAVQIYEWLFGRSDVGAAAALSIVLAVTLGIALAIYFRWFYSEDTA